MEIINVGHTNFVVKVETTGVQDPRSSLKSSWRLLTNTSTVHYFFHGCECGDLARFILSMLSTASQLANCTVSSNA